VKSLSCSPSPKISIVPPVNPASMKREKAMSGRWRGPKIVK
jgi:hypothetical protein